MLPTKTYSTGRTVINWKEIGRGFTVEHEGVTYVVKSNEMIEKTSKTGNTYKTRRLVITDVNELVELEIGADSFKKMSFIKRFKKLLDEVKVEVIEEEVKEIEDTFDYESHRMTDSERVEQQNELYRLLMERGLIQAYTDWEHGKQVDKATMERVFKAIDDSIKEEFDLDEVEKMLQESA